MTQVAKEFGSFNSMIVRLKDEFDSRRRTIDARFQFYDSPIKRLI